MGMWSYKVCGCFTRTFWTAEAEPPPDVKEAFEKYSEGGEHMTAEQLRRFLVEAQGQTGASIADAESVLEHIPHKKHHHHHIVKSNFTRHTTLTLDDFHHYLFSVELNPPIQSQVYHDMKAPLSHYFIYTGHNSYLTGNQVYSKCSVVPIINALKSGVRVIELDIWPNSKKDDVIVKHGGTATTPVKLIKCLESIKKHAFSTNPYPVVITLEDHLTPELQSKVAQMLTQTFGKMLLIPESESLREFRSPKDLENHIIISTKPPKECCEARETKGSEGNKLQKEKDSKEDVLGKKPSDLTADQESDDKCDDDENSDDSDKSIHASEPPEYKRLIAIHAGKSKGGLTEALKVEIDRVRRISLSELKLKEATGSHGKDLVRFTQKNFLRVYPKGSRIDSSNYNPLIGWMHGAQLVAFNMQGYGESLWLMHGMFRSNGGCGYVKKPDFLMDVGPNNQVFDPKAKLSVKKTLKVKVYMGDGWHLEFKHTHFDWFSPPDFYTRVGIAGVPADETIMQKTKRKEDEWAPVWNEEFTFPLTVPELALLRIEVHEFDMHEKDDFAGQSCLLVSELREGIRAIPLYDYKGEKFKSVRLLMRFEFV